MSIDPVDLYGVGTRHSREFVAFAEIDSDEPHEVGLTAEKIGGHQDGERVQVGRMATPSAASRQKPHDGAPSKTMLYWNVLLNDGLWLLTLTVDGKQADQRTIEARR